MIDFFLGFAVALALATLFPAAFVAIQSAALKAWDKLTGFTPKQ